MKAEAVSAGGLQPERGGVLAQAPWPER
jgi:hypothetical protein